MLLPSHAIKLLTSLLTLVIVFHVLILLGSIPYTIAWGGRLKSREEMLVFETVSILLNVFLIGVLALKAKNLKHKFADSVLWIFFGIFSLNTVGNLLAETNFEKYFSIVTLIFALLLWKIVRAKSQ